MEDRVGVGMTSQTTVVGNLDASQHEPTASHQGMNVVPLPDPKTRHGRRR